MRGLVPTPRALELRERVSQLVQDGEGVLRLAEKPDLTKLVRTFTLRTSEDFVENFGPELIARVGHETPGVRLRFVQKPNNDGSSFSFGVIVPEPRTILKRQNGGSNSHFNLRGNRMGQPAVTPVNPQAECDAAARRHSIEILDPARPQF